jgi:hypothetical protein
MSKFLKIVEQTTPNTEKKSTQSLLKLFNHMWVDDVEVVGENRIKVTLFSGESVEFEVVNYVGKKSSDAAEDNEQVVNKNPLSSGEQMALNVASKSGIAPRKSFMGQDPEKKMGKALGNLYNKLSGLIDNVANKIR